VQELAVEAAPVVIACQAVVVGEKPGRYWDHTQCGWVRYDASTAEAVSVAVPEQAAAGDDRPAADDRPVAATQEADVRSG
jgi:hypothetical protein